MSTAAHGPTQLSEASAWLLEIGYPMLSRLTFAAARLLRAPAVLADLREYLRLGCPAVDASARTPTCLLRPLAHDLTLATLMSEALLAPSGAFLLAAEMEQDPQRADALLARLIADGMWTVAADGTRSLRRVPLAGRYPRCQRCGRPMLNPEAGCARCDNALGPNLSTSQQQLAQLLDWLDAPGSVAAAPIVTEQALAAPTCPRCGGGNRPDARFCAHCGDALEAARHCPGCGSTLNPGARFCGRCGAAIDS